MAFCKNKLLVSVFPILHLLVSLPLTLLCSPMASAMGSQGTLTETSIFHCVKSGKMCLQIESETMSQSLWKPLIAFANSKMTITEKGQQKIYPNVSGYIDFKFKLLVVNTTGADRNMDLNIDLNQ